MVSAVTATETTTQPVLGEHEYRLACRSAIEGKLTDTHPTPDRVGLSPRVE